MAVIASPIDWLGVNYYSRGIVSDAPDLPWPSTRGHEGPLPKTQMGWEIYPDGLRNLLICMARDYGMTASRTDRSATTRDATISRRICLPRMRRSRQARMLRGSSTGRCWTISNGRSAMSNALA